MIIIPTFRGCLSRATTFSPSDLSGLVQWLKADAITGLSDGDPVSTWGDSSGNGRDASGSGSARPVYKTNILNGKPTVRFDGVDDTMSLAALTLTKGISAVTLFAVCRFRSLPTVQKDVFRFNTNGSGSRVLITGGFTASKFVSGGRRLDGDSFQSVASTTNATTAAVVICAIDYSATLLQQYINGTLEGSSSSFQTSGSTSNTDSSKASLGSSGSGGQLADVDIFEVGCYLRFLNSTEIEQLTSYAQSKYAL